MPEIALNLALMQEIDRVFPSGDMPDAINLTQHGKECFDCNILNEEIVEYRSKSLDGSFFRLIHQELYNLSNQAWLWMLPQFLKYSLTNEAHYNRFEIEFFTYSIESDTDGRRLSLLNCDQLFCLLHFFQWCSKLEYWNIFFKSNMQKAVNNIEGCLENKKIKN